MFVPLLTAMQEAVIIPLGPKPLEAVDWAMTYRSVQPKQVLCGLPHPSGSNAERVAYFVGRKRREQLSDKTNADKLDEAKRAIRAPLSV